MIQAISSRLLLPTFSGLGTRQSAPVGQPQAPSLNEVEIKDLLVQLGKLQSKLEQVEVTGKLPLASSTPAQAASATATSAIGLSYGTTYTTLRSTEEVNATPTSFSTFGPDWVGSTAQASIGGEYDGSNGTGTLTFRVDRDGTHGVDDLTIKVYDPDENEIDKIDIKKEHPIGQQYTLSNGLVLNLGEGDLLDNDTFTVDVVDSVPTSFTPTEPDWTGSGALVTMDGAYDGSNGTGTLTFRSDKTGTHGVDDLTIKVYDPDENEIDKIDIKKEHPIGQQYTLSNGLVLNLGDGDLLKDTTFTLDVYESVGSVVDPDKPLTGTRTDNPNLEYGLSVTAGSFQANGVTIDVYASDTVNTVLDRVTQSEAGVSATFDAATETILLTQKTAGSVPTIVLENDTSGFIQAMKLDAATPTQGGDADPAKPLADVPAFSSVQSGTIRVQGVDVSIDVNTDSLNDVIARINASAADVTASLNQITDIFTVTANSAGVDLVLDDGTSGLFTALNITPGTYEGEAGAVRAQGVTEPRRVREGLQDAGRLLDGIFKLGAMDTNVSSGIRTNLRGAIAEAFEPILGDDERSIYRSGFGIDFDFRDFSSGVFRLDVARFNWLTGEKADQINNFLFRKQQDSIPNGLVASLIEAVKGIRADLTTALQSGDRTGLLVDLSA